MNMHDPPQEEGGLRGTLELSYEVRRGQEAIRKAIRDGRIQATKVGGSHSFNRAQWAAAVAYYRELDARQEGHSGAERPS